MIADTRAEPGQGHVYRPAIDGLRAVAVLGVLLYHAGGFGVTGGFGGVDVFFVISGFLITSIIQREIESGTFSLLNFYERRIRRIFPALAAVAAVATAVSMMLLLPDDLKEYGKSLQGIVTLSSNFYFQRKTGYFDASAQEKPLLHTWSLAVEEQFYVVFPLLLLLLYRFSRNSAAAVLAIIAIASFALSVRELDAAPARAFFSTLGRVWELLTGAIVAFLCRAWPLARGQREAAVAAGLAMIGFGYFAYSDATLFPGPAALAFCLGAAFVLYGAAHEEPAIAGRFLASPPMVGVGLISYSVYLWHWPLIVFVRYRYPELFSSEGGPGIALRLSLVAAGLALGFLSWRFIERPFRRPTGTAAQRYVYLSFVTLTALLAAISFRTIRSEGFPGRWPSEVGEMLKHRERPEGDVCKPIANSGIWPKDTCRIGPETGVPDTLLWGDSHALMLIDGFDTAIATSNRSVIVSSLPGCPPLAGVMLYGRSRAEQCHALVEDVLTAIAQSEVRKVVLAGRWAYYAEGRSFDKVGGSPPRLGPNGVEDNPAIFAALFETTVRRLQALGREVVIIGPVPEHRFPVALTMARNLVWKQPLPLELTRAEFAERQRHVLPLLQRLSTWPGVRVLYPDRIFCGPATCRYSHDSAPMYVDANHLGPTGIKFTAPLIDEIFVRPPRR